MNGKTILSIACALGSVLFFNGCSQAPKADELSSADTTSEKKVNYGGFDSQEKWGEHLVMIGGCNDCHTPKKMTDHGPDLDLDHALSGHPAQMPAPDVNRKEMESKGYAVTQTLTAWVGPWGISYAANLTSDPTGIGGWTEENFLTALRKGKYKGIESGRPLMPPMPWQSIGQMSDDELKAIFAYLKSTNPVSNVVPEYQPPVSAASGMAKSNS